MGGDLDPSTGEPLYLTITNEESDYEYAFVDIPVGFYQILASTDSNEDGFICDETEFCGGYPMLYELSAVPVLPDTLIVGVDFTLDRAFEILSPNKEGIGIADLMAHGD